MRLGAGASCAGSHRRFEPHLGGARVRLQAFAVRQLRGDRPERLRARPRSPRSGCVRFWKSYTPSGEEKRAVPEVGSTWFGPAQ